MSILLLKTNCTDGCSFMDCAYIVHTCTDMELLRDVGDFCLPCFVPDGVMFLFPLPVGILIGNNLLGW